MIFGFFLVLFSVFFLLLSPGDMVGLVRGPLVRLGKRAPYQHLYHPDGSLYMERFWLVTPRGSQWSWGVRLHHIVTADMDRDMHDHPGAFLSVVLSGGYAEERPIDNAGHWVNRELKEPSTVTWRQVGSVAFRGACDRHRITSVSCVTETWTLVVTGPKRHWWGFYTPVGKIHWKDYPSNHEKKTGGLNERA